MIKVLNLYAGIGGNRKLWKDVDVTAVEINPEIAKIYSDLYPKDKVIVGDAHKYLIENYKAFDFIWSSPPCPTHSRIRKHTSRGRFKDVYPDMALWQEIVFLQHHFKGSWIVENVISYYEPFIRAQKSGRHYFWSNGTITDKKMKPEIRNTKHREKGSEKEQYFPNAPKQCVLNAVHPELGKHVFDCVVNNKQMTICQR